MKKCKVQVIAGHGEVYILPIEDGDKPMYFRGAAGFYEANGKPHSTFFQNTRTLAYYIERAKARGFDDTIFDPFDIMPLSDTEQYMDAEEIAQARGVSVEIQKNALAIKEYLLERYAN